MILRPTLSGMFAAALAGCATPSNPEAAAASPAFATAHPAGESAPGGGAQGLRPLNANPDAITLDAFEVKESAFSDFGMSVKTNVQVQWNGSLEWMQVSGVAAASSAVNAGLAVGDRILAIDGRSVARLSRGEMLAVLFERKKGESSRLLVLGTGQALPRSVQLIATPSSREQRS